MSDGGEGGIYAHLLRKSAVLRLPYGRLEPLAIQESTGLFHLRSSPCGFEPTQASMMCLAERVGFEPTVPFGITGFQDQLLKPLGHLSNVDSTENF